MTETTTTRPTDAAHACPGCGVRTPPDRAEPAVTVPVFAAHPSGKAGRLIGTTPLTRCADCRALRDRARALLDAHPGMRARLGNIADERAEAALCALVLLRVPLPERVTEADLSALLRHLAHAGAAARWEVGARPGEYAAQPWAHVDESKRADLRAAYATLLRERLAGSAPDVALVPPAVEFYAEEVPAPGGCLMCGVHAVTVAAAQVARLGGREAAQRAAWRSLSTSPASLGGRRSPARVTGYVCPVCSEALASVGAVGPTTLERALAEHLASTGRETAARRFRAAHAEVMGTVPGLVGWGALYFAACRRDVAPPRPNAAPWAHLDLSEVTG